MPVLKNTYKYYFIYRIINLVNKKSYVGFHATNKEYYEDTYFGSGLMLHQAIKKYGLDKFIMGIIEYVNVDNWKEKEIFWIKTLKSHAHQGGYNETHGGEGTLGLKLSYKRDSKNMIKSRMKRIKESGYTKKEIEAHKIFKEKLIEANQSKEGRERVSKQFKGKKKPAFTEDHRKNIGKASTGRKIPGKNISIENKEYESLHEASRILEIPLMTIRNRLINKKFSDWIYLDK